MLSHKALAGAGVAAGPYRPTNTRRRAPGIVTAVAARRPSKAAAAAGTAAPPAPTTPDQGSAVQPASPLAESRDLEYNGFRSTRRTKLIATIGPACDDEATLEALAGEPPVPLPFPPPSITRLWQALEWHPHAGQPI